MTDSAHLDSGGKVSDYPVLSGSVGPDVIDIRKLYANTGRFTFDTGFTSTASCVSKITYIDGDVGTLLYRGYPIDPACPSNRASSRSPICCLTASCPTRRSTTRSRI